MERGYQKDLYKLSVCPTGTEFKVLHRVHFSKTRLSRMFPGVEDRCDRCHTSPCNLSHMFYSCSNVYHFWQEYFGTMSKILKIKIDICPFIAVFGGPQDCSLFTSKQLDILAFTSLLAQRRLLLHWKSDRAPSISQWLQDVMFFLKVEKIWYELLGNSEKFFGKWQPFVTYFSSLKVLLPD